MPESKFLKRVKSGEFRIDSQGRIWDTVKQKRAEIELGSGYLVVRGHPAHRIVYAFFKGKIKKGLVIHHKNGKRNDNRPNNLMLLTKEENSRMKTQVPYPNRVYTPPAIKEWEFDGGMLHKLRCKKKLSTFDLAAEGKSSFRIFVAPWSIERHERGEAQPHGKAVAFYCSFFNVPITKFYSPTQSKEVTRAKNKTPHRTRGARRSRH